VVALWRSVAEILVNGGIIVILALKKTKRRMMRTMKIKTRIRLIISNID
jgi:hypothetical protein